MTVCVLQYPISCARSRLSSTHNRVLEPFGLFTENEKSFTAVARDKLERYITLVLSNFSIKNGVKPKTSSCSICWYVHVLIVSKAIVAEKFAPVLCHSLRDVVQLSQTLSPKLSKDGL